MTFHNQEAEILLIVDCCVVELTAQPDSYVPCLRNAHSLSDKLRVAASSGQVDYLRQLLTAGVASFESDPVSCIL